VNISTTYSAFALLFVFILSYTCDWVFKIRSDKFYRLFHFAGGFLIYILADSLSIGKIAGLIFVVLVGIAWEIYEWAFWKYISKTNIDRPKKKDTTNDLIMDFVGGLSALILTGLI